MCSYYNSKNDFLEEPREEKSKILSGYVLGQLCIVASTLPNNSESEIVLISKALDLYNGLSDKQSFSQQEAIRCAKVAFSLVHPQNTSNKESSCKKRVSPVVTAVDNFLATQPNVYISAERQELYLVEKGFLKRYAPENIKELQLPEGYSPTEKKRLFSLLRQRLDISRCVPEQESLDYLVPKSACVFEDGTVLDASNGQLSVCRHDEWKGKPFASAIKAGFNKDLAEAGYNYNIEALKAKAPNFWYYLHSSFDLEAARKRLCQMIGAVLTPVSTASIPSIWNLIGEPGSGKGVICNFLQHIFDPEAIALVTNPPTKHNRFAFSRLITARKAPRFLLTPDISSADVFDPCMFNMIAGGDNFTVEEKGVKSQNITGKLTWVIASNSHLKFRSNAKHLSEKIVEIPFETHTNYRDSEKRINRLEGKLLAEADAILSFSWGVFARTIKENERVNYKLKQKILACDFEFNPLLEMLEKHAIIDVHSQSTVYEVLEAFRSYTEDCGLSDWVENLSGESNGIKPSKKFSETFRKWLDANNLKYGNVVRRGKATARTYGFYIDLDVAKQSFLSQDNTFSGWKEESLSEAGILSNGILAGEENNPAVGKENKVIEVNSFRKAEAKNNSISAEPDVPSKESSQQKDVLLE